MSIEKVVGRKPRYTFPKGNKAHLGIKHSEETKNAIRNIKRGQKKSHRETPCWVWPYSVDRCGYGSTRKGNAHRIIFEFIMRPVPNGFELDHKCKNRICVNPSHLEIVTHAENSRRGRNSKLSQEIAIQIRALAGQFTHRELGKNFGVTKTCISDILKGKTWK